MADHTVILTLPAAAYDKFVEACENPPEAPEELKSLFREMSPFLHPAEAATRENGDLVESLMKGEPFPDMRLYTPELDTALTGYQLIRHETRDAIIAALSTHQQQGAESELVKRLLDYSNQDATLAVPNRND